MPNYPIGKIFVGYRRRLWMRERVEGLSVTRTWIYPATGHSALPRLIGYLSFSVSSLVGSLLVGRFDYVLVESPPLFLGATAYALSRLRRIPFILIVSDLWPASAAELGIVSNRLLLRAATRLEQALYEHAHRVLGVTNGIVQHIASRVPNPNKVVFAPNGVDVNLFHRLRGRIDYRPTASVFLFAGTHGYAQGLDVILSAAELLRAHTDIEFWMVGDGPEKTRLMEVAAIRDLRNVKFLQMRSINEMPELFCTARASIVPLRKVKLFDGVRPSKIFPSMACETPVIFCGGGETARLINDAGCGMVVPPEDPDALADAVRHLAGDPQAAREMGRRGRAAAVEHYSWPTVVGDMLQKVLSADEAPAPS
jgi:glycosyltransferase involved in cell wall biosynthesis